MVLSTALYVGCLAITTVVQKTVLAVFQFPSSQFLALFRMSATIILLRIGRRLQYIQFPSLDWSIARTMLPLSAIYLSLMVTGLVHGVTLTRPVAAVSRRFVTVMTMILEEKILGIQTSRTAQYGILTMMVGAIVSAAEDVSILWYLSYIMIMINNMLSAVNGVYLKKVLDCEDINIWGLLYYDACLMIVPNFVVTWASGDFEKSIDSSMGETLFWWHILISCVMNIVLTYSMMLVTQAHSALSITAISNLWSIFVTYFMLMILGRMTLTWNMFVGLHINLLGAVMYIYSRDALKFKNSVASARHTVHDKLDINT